VTPADVVVDASAIVRGLQQESREAEELLRGMSAGSVAAHAPDLVGPECTNALLRLVRAGRLTRDDAVAMLDVVSSPVIHRHATAPHTHAALEVALGAGISAYDAFYVVLAELVDAPLVTADRQLAESVARAVLV
jgi:predicted nucleic acid-binding protein